MAEYPPLRRPSRLCAALRPLASRKGSAALTDAYPVRGGQFITGSLLIHMLCEMRAVVRKLPVLLRLLQSFLQAGSPHFKQGEVRCGPPPTGKRSTRKKLLFSEHFAIYVSANVKLLRYPRRAQAASKSVHHTEAEFGEAVVFPGMFHVKHSGGHRSPAPGYALTHWHVMWRRERDSNPRWTFAQSGFQDRLFQPLTHPSAGVRLFVS